MSKADERPVVTVELSQFNEYQRPNPRGSRVWAGTVWLGDLAGGAPPPPSCPAVSRRYIPYPGYRSQRGDAGDEGT